MSPRLRMQHAAVLILILKLVTGMGSVTLPTESPQKCRGRIGSLSIPYYRLSTCAGCYGYLFPRDKELRPFKHGLGAVNSSNVIEPDIHNETKIADVCRTLNKDECSRWQECCTAAEQCCQAQVETPLPTDGKYCPRTWDGYACWDDTPSGQVASTSCPQYIPHAIPTLSAYKTCWENATWYSDPKSNWEWTNYTKCLNMDDFKVNMYISLACNVASLAVLLPSTAIFLAYRQLRKQHRIRLHINLFVSFILYNLVNILWHWVVVYDRMTTPTTQTIMYQNTVSCRIVYVLTRYARSTNYLWMFCEGFFLHRLIVKAFEPPKRLFIFYLVGWGVPVIPVAIYSGLRTVWSNTNCWVKHIGPWEWFIYIPNLVSLVANMFFLAAILRILLTQLSTHPNEPSSYRRALKATFVLVPLFGLQLFLIIYRPPYGAAGGRVYEIVSALITDSQGFFVALIFCVLNGEVLSQLERSCARIPHSPFLRHRQGAHGGSMNTQTSEMFTRDTSIADQTTQGSLHKDKRYIPMRPITNGQLNKSGDDV